MKKGLVFGKFMPLHVGHISLIEFATKLCDNLYVVLCYTDDEEIPGIIREQWLRQALAKYKNVIFLSFRYNENQLPNTSTYSSYASGLWSEIFKNLVPGVDVVFTSEEYGEHVANFMGIDHVSFDKARSLNPVSATDIREDPFGYWDYISGEAKPYFVKKIVILGSESTGKSTLTENLAAYYNTLFVSEAGREVVAKTEECSFDDLIMIAELHGKKISEQIKKAHKLLFIDTDINITKSYASFLFNKNLIVSPWIEEINKAHLYLFLETDCPFIQDGTRISEEERANLSLSHKKILAENGIKFFLIAGNWEERFHRACEIIDREIKKGDNQ